jgi:putative glycosyltransferase (TIGR04372 family)
LTLKEPHQYTPFLQHLVEKLWDKSRYFVVVPCSYYFGHLFWEIIMAVAVARRSGRTLVLLKPTATNQFPVMNQEVFDCDFDCKLERSGIWAKIMPALNTFEKVKTELGKLVFKAVRKAFKVRWAEPAFRYHRCGIEESDFVLAKIAGTNRYYDLSMMPDGNPAIRLSEEQRAKAEHILKDSGMDQSKWIAAAHVREAGYKGYDVNADARNFGQTALLPMLKLILARGGTMVRMGTREQSHIPETRGLFDYAHSPIQSNLLDLYVMEKARIFVGASSGPLVMAFAFGKPVFAVNYVDFLLAGFRKSDMFIPKVPYCPQEHRYLSLAEYCERVTSLYESKDFWFVDNSIEDIEEAFSCFLSYMDRGWVLSADEAKIYQEWIHLRRITLARIIETKNDSWMNEKFKDVAISTLDAPALLAPSYLKRHLRAS